MYSVKKNNCCFTDCVKKEKVGMYSDVYELIWSSLKYDDRYY